SPETIRLGCSARKGAKVTARSAARAHSRARPRPSAAGPSLMRLAVGSSVTAGLFQQTLARQIVPGDGRGVLAAHGDARVELLQRLEIERGEYRLEQFLNLRILLQHRLADDGRRLVDGL